MIENNDEIMKYKLLQLLIENPEYVLLIKNKYIDEDVWRICIENEPSLFRHMKNPSIDICEFALSVDGYNLRYIEEYFDDIEITPKMAYIAVKNCPNAIFYVPPSIIDDGLKEIAFDANPALMKEFKFKDLRYEYVRKLIADNPQYIRYINNPPDELVMMSIEKNPNVYVYIDKPSLIVQERFKSLYPEVAELYQSINLGR